MLKKLFTSVSVNNCILFHTHSRGLLAGLVERLYENCCPCPPPQKKIHGLKRFSK